MHVTSFFLPSLTDVLPRDKYILATKTTEYYLWERNVGWKVGEAVREGQFLKMRRSEFRNQNEFRNQVGEAVREGQFLVSDGQKMRRGLKAIGICSWG